MDTGTLVNQMKVNLLLLKNMLFGSWVNAENLTQCAVICATVENKFVEI